MLELESNLEFCKSELIDVCNLFENTDDLKIRHIFNESEIKVVNTIVINGKAYAYGNLISKEKTQLERKRLIKRYAKLSVFKALSSNLNQSPPWGALTGVRPTKLAYQQLEFEGEFKDFFINTMKVSPKKIQLIERVLERQKGIYRIDESDSDLFVFIPFCPSRCKYCSFITADINHSKNYEDEYVNTLVDEIEKSSKLIKNLRSIYIGGGTPVALSNANLEKVLKAIDKINCGVEFTVEAGRPDRITKENLELFKKYRVTRICINPQTFNDKTLEIIGRKHTANDIIEKYELAKNDFIINMDLIAGLDGESVEDFKLSLDKAVELKPQNITVHTLSIKHGSYLAGNVKRLDKGDIEIMVDYAYDKLTKNGYLPYYLYRQKYMAGNLENVGYSKKGYECIYNVDVMEETTDTVACGAGAISKKVNHKKGKILRVGAPKDLKTYIEKSQKIIEEKENTFVNG